MFRSLKTKISLIYLCLVILIGFVGMISIIDLYNLSITIDNLMTNNYRSISSVTNMSQAVESQDRAILTYMNIDRQKGIDLFTENNDTFAKWFNIENNNITERGEKKLVDNTNQYYSKYVKSFLQLQEISRNQGIQKAHDFYTVSITPIFMKLKLEMKAISLLNEKAMFNGKNKANENSRYSMYVLLLITSFVILAGFFTSRYLANRFLHPIDVLRQTIKFVTAGDYSQQAKIMSQDEIGELANEFNNMTRRLQQYELSALGKLMTEKNRFISIVKSISDPLIVMDSNYKIILINHASDIFFNINEENVITKHFLEVIRNSELFDHISATLESKEEYKEKIIQLSSNDANYYLNVVVTNVKDNQNNITSQIVLFQNVTSLKQIEQVRTDYIATISHEFKTPLTSIILGADLLQEEGIGTINKEQQSIVFAIKEDSEKLSTLINDLLELSNIESSKAIFRIESCSIVGIIEDSVKQFFRQAEQNNVIIDLEVDENLPKVFADYEKITWVINNLISNALKYTNAGDTIAIKASVKGEKMYISVKDSGAGIPLEYQNRIFDKFVQIKGNDLEIRGTGLGLAVVKSIIDAHDEKIWCESSIDSGSNFTFTLKLNK